MPPERSAKDIGTPKTLDAVGETELDESKRFLLAFVDCFNHGRFHEAHDVLEPLWRLHRQDATGTFYKGLIQLAGAFYHVQKQRVQPALSLFKQAKVNVEFSPGLRQTPLGLSASVLVQEWTDSLESGQITSTSPMPQVRLT